MTRKKTGGESRSGILFMILIIIVLGIIAYAYKDKFEPFSKYIYTASDKLFNKNSQDKNQTSPDIKEKIIRLENSEKIKKNYSTQTAETKKTQSPNKTDEKQIFTKKSVQVVKRISTTTTTTVLSTVVKNNNISSKSVDNSDINKSSSTIASNKEIIKTDVAKSTEDDIKISTGKVYFTKINDEQLLLTGVSRSIAYKNAPLTETLKKLLEGPSASEEVNDIITNIPDNTALLSAWVNGETAYVNFSKDFENNRYGRESTILQLKQIVFTATEFKTIKNVQILIEGKNQTYLGGEGIIIGRPLSRNDFS